MSKKILAAGFDHPCKQTCSGWAQGRERGLFDAEAKSRPIIEKFTALAEAWSAYDGAIRKVAKNGDFELDPLGAIAEGVDLDSLYFNCVKAEAAIAQLRRQSNETKPG
jgi:hypothetical protein